LAGRSGGLAGEDCGGRKERRREGQHRVKRGREKR
jgi:hypothetical protein